VTTTNSKTDSARVVEPLTAVALRGAHDALTAVLGQLACSPRERAYLGGAVAALALALGEPLSVSTENDMSDPADTVRG